MRERIKAKFTGMGAIYSQPLTLQRMGKGKSAHPLGPTPPKGNPSAEEKISWPAFGGLYAKVLTSRMNKSLVRDGSSRLRVRED